MAQNGDSGEDAVAQAGFSPFICACFTLNYIVGTGFLALPWAFYQAGWLFSGVMMVCVCVIANMGSDYLLSAMARAECFSSYIEEGKLNEDEIGSSETGTEGSPLVATSTTGSENGISTGSGDAVGAAYGSLRPLSIAESPDDSASLDIASKQSLLLVGERRFDVPELCQIFLGDLGFKGYFICVSLYLYGALWSFTSVFGSAVALAAPPFGLGDPYAFFVLCFSLIVVPMSYLELSEQKVIQVILSGSRILMIILMIFTPVAAAIFSTGEPSADQPGDIGLNSSPHFGDQVEPTGASLLDISGIHRMLPIMVYATVFHFSVPALSGEVKEKSQLGEVFALTFLLCGALYSCIGGVVAWYFGDDVEQSSNLNWGNYHGGTGRRIVDENGETEWVDVALWARVVSFFVVIFPAINVISAFPLHALVLGNSLMGVYYGKDIHEAERNRRVRTIFRTVACIPPLVGGLFVRDLGTITDYTGLSGLAIAFCFPALLYIGSERKTKRMGLPGRTHYERFGSSKISAVAVLAFGGLSILSVFVLLVFGG